MAEFVQIGDVAFNPNLIREVWFRSGIVYLYFTGNAHEQLLSTSFAGDEYEAFLSWWEHKANVDKVL